MMQYLHVVFFAVFLATCLAQYDQEYSLNPDPENAWQIFLRQYKITPTPARKAAFMENLKLIQKHNEEYRAGKQTFWLRMNGFGAMTHKQFLDMYTGLVERSLPVRRRRETRDNARRAKRTSKTSPTDVDLRSSTSCVTPVKYSGWCESAYAYVAVSLIEYHHCMNNKEVVLLSEQEIVDCSHAQGNSGCSGGWYDWAWQYVKKTRGLATSKDYPDSSKPSKTSVCKKDVPHVKIPELNIEKLPQDEIAMRDYVAQTGPIAVAIHTTFEFMFVNGSETYKDDKCNKSAVNHALTIVGYGGDGDDRYWIVKNSWGTDWGDNGYARVERGTGLCGIDTHAMGINMTSEKRNSAPPPTTTTQKSPRNAASSHYLTSNSIVRQHSEQCTLGYWECSIRLFALSTIWDKLTANWPWIVIGLSYLQTLLEK